jgi:hypothetical protein
VATLADDSCVYSRFIEHDSDDLASLMGIMQALISVFLDDRDKLRCINAGNTRINVLIRSPLYYVCVSSWGEPESVVSFKLSESYVFLTLKKQDALTSRISTLASLERRNGHPAAANIRTSHQLRSWSSPRRYAEPYLTFLPSPRLIS